MQDDSKNSGSKAPGASPSITCPRCEATSHNPNDVREQYCGRCHAFHDDMPPRLAPVDRMVFDELFACAKHGSSSGEAAREFLFAWQSARTYGGFDLAKLWRFDYNNRYAISNVFQFILSHPATYPADLPGYAERWAELVGLRDKLHDGNAREERFK